MASILTSAIIDGAKSSVDTYITTANALYGELEGVINTLTGTDFVGDASDGYKTFFDSRVKPALTENLTEASGSLTANLKSILDNIQQQLLNTVDTQLGNNNRSI